MPRFITCDNCGQWFDISKKYYSLCEKCRPTTEKTCKDCNAAFVGKKKLVEPYCNKCQQRHDLRDQGIPDISSFYNKKPRSNSNSNIKFTEYKESNMKQVRLTSYFKVKK